MGRVYYIGFKKVTKKEFISNELKMAKQCRKYIKKLLKLINEEWIPMIEATEKKYKKRVLR